MKAIYPVLTPDSGLLHFRHKPFFDRAGVTCEYWDLRFFARKERQAPLGKIFTRYPDVEIREPRFEDLEELVKQADDSVFVIGYKITRSNRMFFRLLKKYNRPYIVLVNSFTFFHKYSHIIRRSTTANGYKSYLAHITIQRLMKKLNNLAIDISRPVISVMGNPTDRLMSRFPEPSREIVYFHNANYENLLSNIQPRTENNLVVFIDQYLPWHNETQAFSTWNMNPQTYYGKIEQLMLILAQQYGKEAVIATHPKAKQGNIEEFVKNIPVRYGETPALINQSSFCVQHASTTVDQCLLMNKRVIFATCEEVKRSPIEHATRLMAKALNKKVLDIDRFLAGPGSFNLEEYLETDAQRYQQYISDNIKIKGTPEQPYWEFIANYIKNYSA